MQAGISKFFSHGAFFHYCGELFRNPQLRIHLPSFFVDGFLFLTPYIEFAIGMGLLYTPLKRFFTHSWCLYFVTLESAEALEILGQQVVGFVDDPQVLEAAAHDA